MLCLLRRKEYLNIKKNYFLFFYLINELTDLKFYPCLIFFIQIDQKIFLFLLNFFRSIKLYFYDHYPLTTVVVIFNRRSLSSIATCCGHSLITWSSTIIACRTSSYIDCRCLLITVVTSINRASFATASSGGDGYLNRHGHK